MRRDNLSLFLIVDVYYSLLEAHIKRVRIVLNWTRIPLSAEINLQDIDFQSCRFFLCPKKCTKNAPNLAPTHSYGRFQVPYTPHFLFSHAQYNKVISVSKIPLVHFFRLSCKKNARKKGTTLVVPF